MAAVGPRAPRSHRLRKRARPIATYLWVLAVLVPFLFPFAWMLSVALKRPDEIFVFPPNFLPRDPTLANFDKALSPVFLRYGWNSLLVAALTTAVAVFLAVLAGYAFSRLRFRGRRALLVTIIMTQVLPLAVLVVPIFAIMRSLGLIDTYRGLVIAYLTFTIPVAVWLLRGFFNAIPHDLEEAALVDGCTRLQAFVRVILPLSGPGVAATASWVFFVSWQEFMFALTLTIDRSMRTLPVGILDFVGEHVTDWGALMAASVLISLPVFVLFYFIQQQFVAGLTKGGLKG